MLALNKFWNFQLTNPQIWKFQFTSLLFQRQVMISSQAPHFRNPGCTYPYLKKKFSEGRSAGTVWKCTVLGAIVILLCSDGDVTRTECLGFTWIKLSLLKSYFVLNGELNYLGRPRRPRCQATTCFNSMRQTWWTKTTAKWRICNNIGH